MAETTIPLEYARRTRRRWPVLRILLALLLASLAYLAWHYRKTIYDRYHMYSLQRQCMNYTAPADQIVFEEDKARGDALIKRDPVYRQNYSRVSYRREMSAMQGTYRPVLPWEDLDAALPKQATLFIAARYTPRVTVFVHSRQCNSTEVRLVVAELEQNHRVVKIHVLNPGSWGEPPTLISSRFVDDDLGILSTLPDLAVNDVRDNGSRVFAGQPDPKDESRFTIRESIDGVEVNVVCTLKSDDTVHIEVPGINEIRDKLLQRRMDTKR